MPPNLEESREKRILKREFVAHKLKKKKRHKLAVAKVEQNLEKTLAQAPVQVSKVHIDGLSTTKDFMVKSVLENILKAENYGDVMLLTKAAHNELLELGCFHKVNAIIDVSETNEDHLEIHFNVEELPWTYVHGNTETGEDEALLAVKAGIPNISGYGERLETTIRAGTGGTLKSQLEYRLPLRWNLFFGNNLTKNNNNHNNTNWFNHGSYFAASLFRHSLPIPWAGLRSTNHGISISANLSPRPWLCQLVQWEGSWRQVKTNMNDKDPPGFAARSYCGHSLKSSLTHQMTVNTLNDQALATKGLHMQFAQELAGLVLGNVGFFKTIFKAEYFHEISQALSLGVTCGAGIASKIDVHDEVASNLNGFTNLHPTDRFWLGGPLELRGFMKKKISPKEDGNYLGGTAFWRMATHILTKLPYIRGDHWISNNVRGHGFFEIGGLGHTTSGSGSAIHKMFGDLSSLTSRITAGIGLVIRLGPYGRAELNYCFPLKYGCQDSTMNGLQLGIGVNFS